jgi:hypothetical protein
MLKSNAARATGTSVRFTTNNIHFGFRPYSARFSAKLAGRHRIAIAVGEIVIAVVAEQTSTPV